MFIHSVLNQPAICEEFIEGRELRVFIVGNRRLYVYPIREVVFGRLNNGGPKFLTAKIKTDDEYRKKSRIKFQRAALSEELEEQVRDISKRIYRILGLRDYARLDFRLTTLGDLYFLEANPNPSLIPNDVRSGEMFWYGSDYASTIARIARLALQRCHQVAKPRERPKTGRLHTSAYGPFRS
jgi:D-alanine-D-alanine ligase